MRVFDFLKRFKQLKLANWLRVKFTVKQKPHLPQKIC